MDASAARFFMLLIVIIARYLFIAGIAFLLLYVLMKVKWSTFKIQSAFPKNPDYLREIFHSLITSLIFAIVGFILIHPLVIPHTLIYQETTEFGFTYLIISVLLSLFIHDLYFYVIHRWMHTKWAMKHVHRVHHQSTNPSPWAAFAFHPLEAVLEAGILVLLVFVIPLHFWSIMIFLLIMTLYNVYGHLGWELYPKNFHKTKVGRWLNTSVSHNQHHSAFEGNYGLYTLIWDRLFKTIHEDYNSEYERVTNR